MGWCVAIDAHYFFARLREIIECGTAVRAEADYEDIEGLTHGSNIGAEIFLEK